MLKLKKILFVCMVSVLCAGVIFTLGSCSDASDGKVIEYTVATSLVTEDTLPVALDAMIAEIEEKSGGRLVGTSFHNTQLGSQRDYIDGMQMGSMHIAESSTALLSVFDSRFMIFDMPYISRNVEHCVEVLESGLGDSLSESLEKKANLKVIGWSVRTPRNVYSSKGPIYTVDDFKNLKIRTMETKPVMTAMALLGAKPVPIPGTERYMALQTKVVDAAENSSAEILVKKEYEVTDYLSRTMHLIQPNPILISLNFYNSLTPELQKIVMEAGKKAGEYSTQLEIEHLVKIEKALEEHGMKINDVEDMQDFADAMAPLYVEYEEIMGKEVFELFK